MKYPVDLKTKHDDKCSICLNRKPILYVFKFSAHVPVCTGCIITLQNAYGESWRSHVESTCDMVAKAAWAKKNAPKLRKGKDRVKA